MATASVQKEEPALSVDPETAVFLPNGGKSEHMLVNISDKRIAVKVRCSDNSLFRVSPVYMFIEPGSCVNLVITRLPGPIKSDKLVFHYFACEPNDSEPKEVFKINSQKPPEMLKMPINIISAEDVPKIGRSPTSSGQQELK
uniref:Major sperm protein n=1 Tax=Onchocerca volvulus TaxID=6282 RepID=A0A8R1TJD6_ONCVO